MLTALSKSQEFNKILKHHTPAGFSQFYNICVEATGGPFVGRYYWVDDGFYEVEFGRNDIMLKGKKLSDTLLYKSIEEGYAGLLRIPKTKYPGYNFEYLF